MGASRFLIGLKCLSPVRQAFLRCAEHCEEAQGQDFENFWCDLKTLTRDDYCLVIPVRSTLCLHGKTELRPNEFSTGSLFWIFSKTCRRVHILVTIWQRRQILPRSRYNDENGLHNGNGLFSIRYVVSFAMETGYFLCYVRAEGEEKIHDLSIPIEHGLLYKYR